MWGRARETDTGWLGADPDDDLDARLAAEEARLDASAPHVRTLLGPIAPAALGPTLVGESLGALAAGRDGRLAGVDTKAALLAELEDAYAAGVRAIVARVDSAAELADLAWLAGRAPLHLVATAPPNLLGQVSGHPIGAVTVDAPGSKPGSLAKAAAIAASDALAVEVRAGDATAGVRAVQALQESGVPTRRIWVAGSDWVDRGREARAIVDLGAAVAFGALRSAGSVTAGEVGCQNVALIAELVRQGYGNRLLLGSGIEEVTHLRVGGGELGLAGAIERIPLELMEEGVDAMAVRHILVETPARVLTVGAGA